MKAEKVGLRNCHRRWRPAKRREGPASLKKHGVENTPRPPRQPDANDRSSKVPVTCYKVSGVRSICYRSGMLGGLKKTTRPAQPRDPETPSLMYHSLRSTNDNLIRMVMRDPARSLPIAWFWFLPSSSSFSVGANSQPPYPREPSSVHVTDDLTLHQMKEINPPKPAAEGTKALYARQTTRRRPVDLSDIAASSPSRSRSRIRWSSGSRPRPDQHDAYTRASTANLQSKGVGIMAITCPPRLGSRGPLTSQTGRSTGLPYASGRQQNVRRCQYARSRSGVEVVPDLGRARPAGGPAIRVIFAMIAKQGVPVNGVFYKQPYSMVGGGAGACIQPGYGRSSTTSTRFRQQGAPE